MNRLSHEQRCRVINCLIEGCSIRSTVRMTGVAKKTVMRLLVEAGEVAASYQDKAFRKLSCRRLQLDELWAFIGAKQKNVKPKVQERNPHAGDIWLWVAIDAESKLVPSWLLGQRDAEHARVFVSDLASRLDRRVQVTSDGLRHYVDAVDDGFRGQVDFAQLQKIYRSAHETETRYSPAQCVGIKRIRVSGTPDPEHVSTSFIERQNLSLRLANKRYARLTLSFSRKLENHAAAVALSYFAYNFIKIHRTLRVSPAMAAGVTSRLWEVGDLVSLLEAEESEVQRAA